MSQRIFIFVFLSTLLTPQILLAGMPSFLPEDLPTVLRLNEEPHQRLQVISFFLVGIALSGITHSREIPLHQLCRRLGAAGGG